MAYHSALQLHKTVNFELPCFEAITVLNQMTVTSRQTVFLIFKNNLTKIGMNTTSNKIIPINGQDYFN